MLLNLQDGGNLNLIGGGVYILYIIGQIIYTNILYTPFLHTHTHLEHLKKGKCFGTTISVHNGNRFRYSCISVFLHPCILLSLYKIFLYFYIPASLYPCIPVQDIPVFLYSCILVSLYPCTRYSYNSIFLLPLYPCIP